MTEGREHCSKKQQSGNEIELIANARFLRYSAFMFTSLTNLAHAVHPLPWGHQAEG